MKVTRLIIPSILILLAGCQCLTGFTRKPVKAAVYMGDGAYDVGEYHWLQIATFAEGMESTLVDAKAIREGALDGKDLLVMPCGRSCDVSSALGEEGVDCVRRFIRNGGGYIGTDAGDPPDAALGGSLQKMFDSLPSVSAGSASAIVAGNVGNGRIFILTVPPEADLTEHCVVRGALRFVTGRDISWEIPQRTRGQLAVGINMKKGFRSVAAAKVMRALLLRGEYDFIPVNAEILGGGMIHHLDAIIRPDAAGFAQLKSLKACPNEAFGHIVDTPCPVAPDRRRGALSVALSDVCDRDRTEGYVEDLLRDRRFDVRRAWDAADLRHLDAVVLGAFEGADLTAALEAFADNGGTVIAVADTPARQEAVRRAGWLTAVASPEEIPMALAALCPCPCRDARQVAEAASPDGQNTIRLYVNPLCYEVLRNGKPIVLRTPIDLEIGGRGLARNLTREPIVMRTSHGGMTPSDTYKKAFVSLEGDETFADFGAWGVRLAARNDGVAWRFETRFRDEITVTHESAGLAIPSDAECHDARMPFVFKTGDAVVGVEESDLYDFPARNLVRRSPRGAKGPVVLESVYERDDGLTRCPGTRTFPWRCFTLADEYSRLCESDIVYALARKNEDFFMDFSWVRPGKVLTNACATADCRDLIDFAARNGIEYVVLDDPTPVGYGLEKGVGIILSVAWTQIDGDEERMAEHFAKLGVKGLRVDFGNGGGARAERFRWKFADVCARHKLLVGWQGAHCPAGQDRAYPNVVSYGADQGLVMMGFHDGPGSSGTCSRQMALMSFQCGQSRECLAFMAETPVVWEDVKGLGGTPDTYAAVARKAKDDSWWVSAVNNGEPREIEIDTSFLGTGEFEAEIFRDAPDCEVEPAHYVHDSFPVGGDDALKLSLAPGGGAVLRITRIK